MKKRNAVESLQGSTASQSPCSGKFTKEETEALIKAIDAFISENFQCSRDAALNQMMSKRGNAPSLITELGKSVLPNRPPRSIYNFFRRHMLAHKTGKWSDSELLMLLKCFFRDDFQNTRWKDVAKVLERSPEQIHDKFRELKPYIQNYKALVTNPNLSDEEKISKLKTVSRGPFADGRGKKSHASGMASQDQKIYDCIRETMRKSRRNNSIQNVPWTLVQKTFPNYSVTKLRIHFHMSLLPKVYREVYPGFSPNMVARLAIRWIRKLLKRPNSGEIKSLNDIDFGAKFPQLPVIYVKHCTRRAMIKVARRYRRHLQGSEKFVLEFEPQDFDPSELENLSDKTCALLFASKNLKNIIKFAYKNMDVKIWKKDDKAILKRIKRDILPECKL